MNCCIPSVSCPSRHLLRENKKKEKQEGPKNTSAEVIQINLAKIRMHPSILGEGVQAILSCYFQGRARNQG
jgi:hypothetical protein